MINITNGSINITINKKELREKIESFNIKRYAGAFDIGDIKVQFKRPEYDFSGVRKEIKDESMEWLRNTIAFLFIYNMKNIRKVDCNFFIFHEIYIQNGVEEEFKNILFDNLTDEKLLNELAEGLSILLDIDNTVKSLGFSQNKNYKVNKNEKNIFIPEDSPYYEDAVKISPIKFKSEKHSYVFLSEDELFKIDAEAKTENLHCTVCYPSNIHIAKGKSLKGYLIDGRDISKECKEPYLVNSYCEICAEFGKIHPQLLMEHYVNSSEGDNPYYILPGKLEDRIKLLNVLKKKEA